MQIIFYNCSDNPNKIGKTLTNDMILEGEILEDTSLQDPIIRFNFITPPTQNYVYIPSFGRYYFVTGVECLEFGMWRVSMHVDVLESFKEAILNNTGVIDRQEHLYNLYQSDPLIGEYADTFTLCKYVGSSVFLPRTTNVVLMCN